MRKILLVDHDIQTWKSFADRFQARFPEWELVLCNGCDEAWREVVHHSFDVVAVDIGLRNAEGHELLNRVLNRNSQIVRIALVDSGNKKAVLQTLGLAHQHLPRNCDLGDALETIVRSTVFGELMENERMRRLVSRTLALPSVPELYLQLLEELRCEEPNGDRVAEIVQRDMGMCAKLLQVANSAFCARGVPVTNVQEAVLYLGTEMVKALVLSLQIFSFFSRVQVIGFSFKELWNHSWSTALLARTIMESENGSTEGCDQAFCAGLLHDVGQLVLAMSAPSQYQTVLAIQRQEEMALSEAERRVFGCTHAEIGAYLLGLWGLPAGIVEVVAFHHSPGKRSTEELTPLLAVHIANHLNHKFERIKSSLYYDSIEERLLEKAGLLDRLDNWRELAKERDAIPSF